MVMLEVRSYPIWLRGYYTGYLYQKIYTQTIRGFPGPALRSLGRVSERSAPKPDHLSFRLVHGTSRAPLRATRLIRDVIVFGDADATLRQTGDADLARLDQPAAGSLTNGIERAPFFERKNTLRCSARCSALTHEKPQASSPGGKAPDGLLPHLWVSRVKGAAFSSYVSPP